MLKLSRPPMASTWDSSKIKFDEDLDDIPLKLHMRQRNISSDSVKTMADSGHFGYHQKQIHSINEKSDDYPQFLKKASDMPLVVPPRSKWVPLHQKSRFNWRNSFKKSTNVLNNTQVPKLKTAWTLPGMELKRSVTSGFSFKKRDFQPVSVPESEPDLESENCSTLTGPSSGFPERIDSNSDFIRYSNHYVPGEGDSWIFVHRDRNGRLIGQYEIKGSCI